MAVIVEHYAGEKQSDLPFMGRSRERLLLLASSLVLLLGFGSLYLNQNQDFEKQQQQLANHQLVNLNQLQSPQSLYPVLRGVYPDDKDQHFVAEVLYQRAKQAPLPNFGEINKLKTTSAEIMSKGGDGFKARLEASQKLLGFSPQLWKQERTNPKPFPSVHDTHKGGFEISGTVQDESGKALSGTLVTIEGLNFADSVRTDAQGAYKFAGLAPNIGYNVLALKPNAEFKRQRFPLLRSNNEANFSARTHTIRLVESAISQRLKPQTIVRTPEEFRSLLLWVMIAFFGIYYVIHFLWTARKFSGDQYLLPFLHLITGIGLLMMFAIPDPLRDLLRGFDTLLAIMGGLILFVIISFIDIQRWGFEFSETENRSFIWLLLAALTSLLLLTIGYGPEGSNAKVNLHLFLFFGPDIQPVEIIKMFLLIFFAGYLARNWDLIRQLDATLPPWMEKIGLRLPAFRIFLPVALGVAAALGFFYMQKDLGPALVICTTFIVLYAIVRHHWAGLALGLLLLVGGFWLAYSLNPLVGSRITMWLNPWENTAQGGDHLAYAFWSLASGAFTGQSLGLGSPADTPAAHTDMILAALGEELGFLGLLVTITLYGLYFYRGLQIALNTDSRFSLFLGFGIVISSAIQLILIACGTFGLLPLTGVVSPFLSYGKVATVMHFVFAGMLMSLSAQQAGRAFKDSQWREFGTPIRVTKYVFLGFALLIIGRLAFIQMIKKDEWSLRPTFVLQSDGLRNYTYNPRLLRIRDALPLGNIFDRNGMPIAASDTTGLRKYLKTYKDMGYEMKESELRQDMRHYPLKELTFYLLGDLNNRVKWNANQGLYAENRYLSRLRGYDNHPAPREERFTMENGRDSIYTVVKYDYSALLPFLHGEPIENASKILSQDRDMKLTIDARLQQKTAAIIQTQALKLGLQDRFISAVVLDAKKGDLLASVSYPLPSKVFQSPSLAQADRTIFDHALYANRPPGSTIKVATAMAAFRRGGDEAANWTVQVTGNERYFRQGEPRGTVTMEQAVTYSSNRFFATISKEKIGAEGMQYILDAFGFINKNPAYSTAEKIKRLLMGDNLSQAGFGQGEIVAAPMQVARMAAAVANRGVNAMPRFFMDEPKQEAQTLITPNQANILQAYMRKVVTNGTARVLARSPLPISGKTGTAEQTRKRDHAWFVGFVPDGKGSAVVVAVLVEEAGRHGGDIAPIAGSIFDAAQALGYFK
jgi:cell division protein FtsW (lipid II flippase)